MYFLSQSEVIELETYPNIPKMRGVEIIFKLYKPPLLFILLCRGASFFNLILSLILKLTD